MFGMLYTAVFVFVPIAFSLLIIISAASLADKIQTETGRGGLAALCCMMIVVLAVALYAGFFLSPYGAWWIDQIFRYSFL